MSDTRPTVLILGGGPSGSLAGILLARAGVQVTIVEQHQFPRDKVCGECLSALGREVLRRHGLEQSLVAIGQSLERAHLFGNTSAATIPLPSPMLGVSRLTMDQMLLSSARSAGADVRQPVRVEGIEPEADRVNVTARDLRSNQVERWVADFVFIADGRGALLKPRPSPSEELGLKAHFRCVNADASAITLYGGIGCYGGVAPIEDGRWNVAFAIPKKVVATTRGDLDALWSVLIGRSPMMEKHFHSAERITAWLASPLARHATARQWHPRVVPIGAAACAIEPVGGEGMGTALRSAELAAEALLQDRLHLLPAAYATLWRKRSLFCKLGGAAMADPNWCDAVGLARHRGIGRVAMALVGK